MEEPFIVMATQNPIEMEGTFVLPEAQLDRFLMKIKLGYPTAKEEEQILAQVGDGIPYSDIESKLSPKEILDLQNKCRHIHIHPSIGEYIIQLANASRSHPLISIGVSPRASKALYRTVKAWALLQGREFVIPDDVKDMLIPVWNHRLILKADAHINNIKSEDILEEILNSVEIVEEQVVRI